MCPDVALQPKRINFIKFADINGFSNKHGPMKSTLTIEYCPKCNWLLRSAYFAQEFLITFEDELRSVILLPSETSGAFYLFIDDKKVFDRKQFGGFPDIKHLKQIIRDVVNPAKSLGHSDNRTRDTDKDISGSHHEGGSPRDELNGTNTGNENTV
jgi:selenoprotein W-related protein